MSRWKLLVSIAVAAVLMTVYVGGVLAQEEETRPAPPAARGGPRGGQFDPEQMRQRGLELIKEALGATDEEWAVLGPRVEKVQTLSRQTRPGGGMGMFGNRAGREGPRRDMRGGAASTRELSEVDKALQELQASLENQEAKPEDIKKKLTTLREAREKAKQQLDKAQQELRELLSLRQEAQLVLIGLLD
jgi:multidrug resistance efflux pump